MPTTPTPLTPFQIPDDALIDISGQQTYLGNSYTASVQIIIAPALTEVPLFLIRNPLENSVNGFSIGLFNLFRRVSCVTFGSEINFNFYSSPTVLTPGTFINPVNVRFASTNQSSMLA